MPRVHEVVGPTAEIDGGTPLGVQRLGLSRSSRLLKRAFDLTVGSAILLAAAPLMLAIAILVRCDSPGPALFRQKRIGRDGEPFEILKFRTMVAGADAQKATLAGLNDAAAGLFKITHDPRVTRVGRRLRQTSVDELPQLLNVLRGEMSLVGPRPLVGDEDSQIVGLDRRRLRLTPGMTGHWQIAGSSRVPLAEMVKLDHRYVAGWSLRDDVKVLLRTIPYVLSRRGI